MPISISLRMSCNLYWPPESQGQIARSVPIRQYTMNCPFPPAGLKWRPKALTTAFAKVAGVWDAHCSRRPRFQNMGRTGKSLHDLIPGVASFEGEYAVHTVE